MVLDIDSLDYFTSIFEIDMQDSPNQKFDSYINNILYNFEIRTYNSTRSTITIYENGNLICEEAPFIVNRNLTFFTKDDIAFFFLTSTSLESYNYSNLGKELRFFYGSF